MKRIIFLGVFFCIMGSQSSWGRHCALLATPTIDLGAQPGCSVAQSSLTVRNICDQHMDVQLSKSDSGIALKTTKLRLRSREGKQIHFSTKFPKRLGKFTKTITLTWKPARASKSQKTTVKLTGQVQDSNLEVQRTHVDLGHLDGGEGKAFRFIIKNLGSCSLQVWISSKNGWFKSFYPSEFRLSRKGAKEVYCYVQAPRTIGPFKGTITVGSDAGHRQNITVYGESAILDLSYHRISQYTLELKWNNLLALQEKIRDYVIYRNGKVICRKSSTKSTEMKYIFDQLQCDKPNTIYVEGVYGNASLKPIRSNSITITVQRPRQKEPLFDCTPIYGTEKDWVVVGSNYNHIGVDIFALKGTTCRAVFGGKVIDVGPIYVEDDEGKKKYLGKVVKLRPDRTISRNGFTVDYVYYSHLQEKGIVIEGVHLGAGEPIGKIGDYQNGAHLHFGICVNPEGDNTKHYDTACHAELSRDEIFEMLDWCYGQKMLDYCKKESGL